MKLDGLIASSDGRFHSDFSLNVNIKLFWCSFIDEPSRDRCVIRVCELS